MKVAQYVSRGQLEFVTVADPTLKEGEVLVQLEIAAVCGSDVMQLYYSAENEYPLAPGQSGHECVGIVIDAGTSNLKQGQRVLVIPPKFNGWSPYLSIDPKWLIPIPDSMSLEQGVLAQLLGCVIWSLKKVGPVFDKNVAVIGQGPAGLLFTKLLSNMGAKRVIGLDLDDHRLSIARQMGATHTINATDNETYEAQVRDICEGQLADLAIEVVGLAKTVDMTIDVGKEFADLLIFGIPKETPTPVDLYKSLRRQHRWITTVGTQFEPNLSSFRLGMDMIADGRVDVQPLISHCMPFGKLAQAIKMAKTREDKTIKILMQMQS